MDDARVGKRSSLKDKQNSEKVSRLVDRCKEGKMVAYASPGPHDRKDARDQPIRSSADGEERESRCGTEEVGDQLRRPDCVVVSREDVKELFGRERQHAKAPAVEEIASLSRARV
jgi:hypothetical protein